MYHILITLALKIRDTKNDHMTLYDIIWPNKAIHHCANAATHVESTTSQGSHCGSAVDARRHHAVTPCGVDGDDPGIFGDQLGESGADSNPKQSFGYGSIPIHTSTIFRGMNIHKSQLFWCELQGDRVLTHPHFRNHDGYPNHRILGRNHDGFPIFIHDHSIFW